MPITTPMSMFVFLHFILGFGTFLMRLPQQQQLNESQDRSFWQPILNSRVIQVSMERTEYVTVFPPTWQVLTIPRLSAQIAQSIADKLEELQGAVEMFG